MKTITAILLLCLWTTSRSADWYVSSGSVGVGTLVNPGSLATAFSGTGWAASIAPGDTVWLRGGTYTGVFDCDLSGTTNAPIVFRSYSGERAIIDGAGLYGTQTMTLRVDTSNVWFWGIEVTSSDFDRWATVLDSGPSASELPRPNGVEIAQAVGLVSGVKFINMIVHDTRQGFSLWTNSFNVEVYGCIVYNNGWDAPNRGHGHAIYMQNDLSPGKSVINNFLGYQYSQGVEAYGSEVSRLNYFTVSSNSVAYNGVPSAEFTTQILVGGDSVATNDVVAWNDAHADSGTLMRIGYGSESTNAVITNNYFTGNSAGVYFTTPLSMTLSGNSFHNQSISGISTSSYPNNVYSMADPVANTNFFRVNKYETNKAFVAIYNWQGSNNALVDASQLLSTGSQYVIRNSMDYWGDVQTNSASAGGVISIPMTNRFVSNPVGGTNLSNIFPTFGHFQIELISPQQSYPRSANSTSASVGNINKI